MKFPDFRPGDPEIADLPNRTQRRASALLAGAKRDDERVENVRGLDPGRPNLAVSQ